MQDRLELFLRTYQALGNRRTGKASGARSVRSARMFTDPLSNSIYRMHPRASRSFLAFEVSTPLFSDDCWTRTAKKRKKGYFQMEKEIPTSLKLRALKKENKWQGISTAHPRQVHTAHTHTPGTIFSTTNLRVYLCAQMVSDDSNQDSIRTQVTLTRHCHTLRSHCLLTVPRSISVWAFCVPSGEKRLAIVSLSVAELFFSWLFGYLVANVSDSFYRSSSR